VNLRYVLAVCGLIMVLVSVVAGEGGPLDTFSGRAPVAAEGPPAQEPQRVATTAPSVPQGATFASGSDVGIGDYQADDGGYDPTPPAPPARDFASSRQGAPWSIPNGALTDEQLGVEKATGLAPANIAGA
jgi:hypothetical protein